LREIGFSSPFDDTAVGFLESLYVPRQKSFKNSDLPLIRRVAATGGHERPHHPAICTNYSIARWDCRITS